MHRPRRHPPGGADRARRVPPLLVAARESVIGAATHVVRRDVLLDSSASAVAGARSVIRNAVGTDAPDSAELAAVCGSELVANAVRHGAPPIMMTVLSGVDHVVVAVEDGSRLPPLPRAPGSTDTGGRGTVIVERLADRWGVEFLPGGKRVWCLVARQRDLPPD